MLGIRDLSLQEENVLQRNISKTTSAFQKLILHAYTEVVNLRVDLREKGLIKGCPFQIKVRATDDGKGLQICSIGSEHNHETNKLAFEYLPKQRQLDEESKEEARKMLEMKSNKKRLQHHLHMTTGKNVPLKDLHNLVSKKSEEREDCNLKTLLNEMKKIQNSVTDIFADEENILSIFFQTGEMRNTFSTGSDTAGCNVQAKRPSHASVRHDCHRW
eukprot:m.287525 g.287525  ORF g.287525 m.287525 type:complete len:216 (+) comp40703_c0_seq18:103-750(+)